MNNQLFKKTEGPGTRKPSRAGIPSDIIQSLSIISSLSALSAMPQAAPPLLRHGLTPLQLEAKNILQYIYQRVNA